MSDINLREILESIIQESEGDSELATSLALVWLKRLGLSSTKEFSALLKQSKQLERELRTLNAINDRLQDSISRAKNKAYKTEQEQRYNLHKGAELATSPAFEQWLDVRNSPSSGRYLNNTMTFEEFDGSYGDIWLEEARQRLALPLETIAEMRAAWLEQNGK